MDDTRFWAGAEKIEQDFLSDLDAARFRRRMRRKGFPPEVIAEREEAVGETYKMIFGVAL